MNILNSLDYAGNLVRRIGGHSVDAVSVTEKSIRIHADQITVDQLKKDLPDMRIEVRNRYSDFTTVSIDTCVTVLVAPEPPEVGDPRDTWACFYPTRDGCGIEGCVREANHYDPESREFEADKYHVVTDGDYVTEVWK